jgi:hypothetical protein
MSLKFGTGGPQSELLCELDFGTYCCRRMQFYPKLKTNVTKYSAVLICSIRFQHPLAFEVTHVCSLPSNKHELHAMSGSRDSSIGIGTGYVLDAHRFISGRGKVFSPQHPDRPWSPLSVLSDGYRGRFQRG